jgi:hypothetical protein
MTLAKSKGIFNLSRMVTYGHDNIVTSLAKIVARELELGKLKNYASLPRNALRRIA